MVSILAGSGVLATTEDQKNLANFLICAEMLPAAIGMLFAFPYLEYKGDASPTASFRCKEHLMMVQSGA